MAPPAVRNESEPRPCVRSIWKLSRFQLKKFSSRLGSSTDELTPDKSEPELVFVDLKKKKIPIYSERIEVLWALK